MSLFKPLGELKETLCLDKVKDQNIGIGLSCVRKFSQNMGGSASLVQSSINIPKIDTIFKFDINVTCLLNSVIDKSSANS